MKHAFAALALLAAAGCSSMPAATAPPSAVEPSAFTEEAMSGSRYRIAYVAPEGATSRQVSDRVMARAAQVTLDKGQEWFEIANKVDGKMDGKSTQTLVIVMGKGETLAGGPRQYDAKATLASLRDKVS
jgi:hypothetical protein